jgi:hypothetical protein
MLFTNNTTHQIFNITSFKNANINYKIRYYFHLNTISLIDTLEIYLIPTFLTLGIIGNFFGSLCLLSNRSLRKSTILFILAIIGIVDNLFLVTQLQRWIALCFNKDFIQTDLLCKMYFFLIRFSILTSSALLMSLIIIRFIKLYLGTYRLSLYSNIGQIFSKLCIVIIIALTTSTNWHQVWTSGVYTTKGNNLLPESIKKLDKNSPFRDFHLNYEYRIHCIENIESEVLAKIVNYFNLGILVLIFLILIILSIFILVKIFDENFLPRLSYNSANLIAEQQLVVSFEIKKQQSKKLFTKYLVIIAFLNSIFGVLYLTTDILTFKFVYIDRSNLNLENCLGLKTCSAFSVDAFIKRLFKKSVLRLPLILINFNFSFKFYLLFFIYKKFRIEIYKFLRLRLHFDLRILNEYCRRNDCFAFKQQQQQQPQENSRSYNLKAQFRLGSVFEKKQNIVHLTPQFKFSGMSEDDDASLYDLNGSFSVVSDYQSVRFSGSHHSHV